MELKRKISSKIANWYNNSTDALLIKGARQIGKTHVIRKTLSDLGAQYIEINLVNLPEAISIIHEAQTVNDLIMGLSTIVPGPFVKGESVIFIDEIQRCKEMVTKVKFLVEEGSFRYIFSGSLLGVELTNLQSAPVGFLTTYDMFPLDFSEFLQIANITDDVMNHLKECFTERKPVMNVINDKMLSLFRQYLIVGGMPKTVSLFADTHNVSDVAKEHLNIIEQYKLDFTQYEAENKRLLLTNIYDLVPSELLRQNRRFIVSDISKGLHFERVENSFLWLKNAGVVLSAFNATEPRIPLKLSEKQSLFKLYLSDVGMLTSLYGMRTKQLLLSNAKELNAGGIYENAVITELKSKGFDVYYYNSNRLGELDFVIEYNGSILPIEVKSGKDYTVHSALNNCLNNPEYAIKEGFVFANCNISTEDNVVYLPVYMASFIEKESDAPVFAERVEF